MNSPMTGQGSRSVGRLAESRRPGLAGWKSCFPASGSITSSPAMVGAGALHLAPRDARLSCRNWKRRVPKFYTQNEDFGAPAGGHHVKSVVSGRNDFDCDFATAPGVPPPAAGARLPTLGLAQNASGSAGLDGVEGSRTGARPFPRCSTSPWNLRMCRRLPTRAVAGGLG
jgi:hypothetical protein